MKPVINKPIDAGSEYANYLGFTSDKFDGYLWDKGDGSIIISFVASLEPGLGNFSGLVNSLRDKGFIVKIPTPIGQMQKIVRHYGFKKMIIFDEQLNDNVVIWVSD